MISPLSSSEAVHWFLIKSTEKSWSQASRYKLDLIKLFSSTLCPGDSHFGNLPPNPPQHPLCNVLHILQHQLLCPQSRTVRPPLGMKIEHHVVWQPSISQARVISRLP